MAKFCINNSNVARAIWNNHTESPAKEETDRFEEVCQFYRVRTRTPQAWEDLEDPDSTMPVFVRLWRPGCEETRFNCFDKAVYNAVCSLYEGKAGEERYFSLPELLRLLTGEKAPSVTAVRRKKLEETLQKLSECEMVISAYYEVRGRWITSQKRKSKNGPEAKDAVKFGFKGRLLAVRKAEEGRKQTVYCIYGPGALHEYAKEVNSQFITVPDRLLRQGEMADGKKTRRLEDIACTTVIAAELIQQLEVLRSPKNRYHPRTLRYDTPVTGLMAKLEVPGSGTKSGRESGSYLNKKAQVHGEVVARLEYWRSIGYLESYEVVRERRRVLGVDFTGKVNDPWQAEDEITDE